MMIRPQMDWTRLMNHFALCYMCLLRKYGEAPQSNTTTCFIIDDTVLEKSGVRMEGISRVYDHETSAKPSFIEKFPFSCV